MNIRERLFSEPWQFEFYEAVRVLELLYPERAAPGESPDPESEVVRLRSLISFVFPASEVQALAPPEAADLPVTMTVNLFCAGGPNGPLPDSDSDRVIEQSHRRNPAFAEFLDTFHHRLLSFVIRTRKHHYPSYTASEPHRGAAASYLSAFFGLGTPAMRNRLAVPDRALLHYSGVLAQHPRSAAGLECLLSDFFQIPTHIRQLIGRWRQLEPSQWTAIGNTGRNRELGFGALLGTRYWDQQGGFEIVFGPISLPRFLDLLPPGPAFAPLCELTRFYSGPDFEFNFRLILRKEEVPASRLGSTRLGWTSWLKTKKFEQNASQVRVSSRRQELPA